MKRGVFLSLLACASVLPVRVAPAADPVFSIYEITRVRSGGPNKAYVYLRSDGAQGVASFIQLAPRKGGGWTTPNFHVLLYNNTDTRAVAYGPKAGEVPLPCQGDEDLCGKTGEDHLYGWPLTFHPAAGNRYFFALPPDRGWIWVPPQWRIRQVSLAARVVMAKNTTAAGVVASGQRTETFYEATAPGGKYGSASFAMVPCDKDYPRAGSATLKSNGTDKPVPITCDASGYDGAFGRTLDGTTWTVTGPVVGTAEWANRLFVIDFPRR